MPFDPYAYDLSRSAHQAADPLAAETRCAIPQDVGAVLWRGLRAAVEDTLALWERTPAGVKREPPVFNIQHAGQPRFNPAGLRQQTLEGWHRLTGVELRLTVQVLEALILGDDAPRYEKLLGEQCVRLGQLYAELKRRAGPDLARCILYGELHWLRYRASPVVSWLVYD